MPTGFIKAEVHCSSQHTPPNNLSRALPKTDVSLAVHSIRWGLCGTAWPMRDSFSLHQSILGFKQWCDSHYKQETHFYIHSKDCNCTAVSILITCDVISLIIFFITSHNHKTFWWSLGLWFIRTWSFIVFIYFVVVVVWRGRISTWFEKHCSVNAPLTHLEKLGSK